MYHHNVFYMIHFDPEFVQDQFGLALPGKSVPLVTMNLGSLAVAEQVIELCSACKNMSTIFGVECLDQ